MSGAPAPPIPTPDEYFDRLESWLALEGEAERERLLAARRRERSGDPERSGETLVGLRPVEQLTGLAGRWLVDLAKPSGEPLPMNRLRVGSPVVVSDQSAERSGQSGVISRRTTTQLQVALDEPIQAHTVRVDLSPDERTRLKQLAAIARARLLERGESRLRDALLGLRDARFQAPLSTDPPLQFATDLNASQQRAVAHALAAQDVAVIHGPPGTGKTTTLAEAVFQAVRRGETVLATAASNTAVDNLVERLVELMPGVVRVGHPARVFESLRGHTLDELVEQDETNAFVRQLRREADTLQRKAQKRSRSRHAGRERGQRFAAARKLRDEARQLERSIVRNVLNQADVVATTLTLDEELMAGRTFDLLVVDEACQATEPALWQAALRAGRVVLAGDHRQLPPTVLSPLAAAEGLAVSPMERLVDRSGDDLTRRLDVQYRMNAEVMRLPNREFYEGTLVAHESARDRRLSDLDGVSGELADAVPVEFCDTAGAEWWEEFEPDTDSKRNPREAAWVIEQVGRFIEAGIAATEIGVITPYAAQVRLLRSRLRLPGLVIDTVDGFQGREREVIIVSFVRSNPEGEVGFLSDTRRTNVALTRARRAVRLVGDSATLARHPFYAALVEHHQERGAYRTVWES